MSKREEILDKLSSITNLPTFPDVVVKLSELLQNPETSTEEIVKVIKLDPVIASSILHLANTVAFNSSSKISSIEEAVVRIGFRNVSNVVFSLSVIRILPTKNSLVNYNKFWNHSLSVAYGAQIIEQHATRVNKTSENLYVAGLLHDIGILVFDQFFENLYTEVITKAKKAQTPLHLLEQEILGINHAELGKEVLQRWQLPEEVLDSVSNIYKPHKVTAHADKVTKILHMANYACENQGIGNGITSFPLNFSNTAWFDVGLNVDDIPQIIKEVNAETAKAKAIFNVASSSEEPQKSIS